MASYPPPPPPPLDGNWKAQQRAMRDQAKLQQRQWRMQQRAARRSSIVGPMLLVAAGVVFLLIQMGRLAWEPALVWFGRWWPLLLILAGAILILEWALDQKARSTDVVGGVPVARRRVLGGGTVWLLVLLAIFGGLAHATATHIFNSDGTSNYYLGDFDRALGEAHDSDDALLHAIAPTGNLTVDNSHGDVSVTGNSDDGQVHIAVHKQVYAMSDGEADGRATKLRPTVEATGDRVYVTVPEVSGGHADLTIDVPRGVTVTVSAGRGEVRVSGMHAPVLVNGDHGNVDISAIDGAVTAHLHSSDATFSAHSIRGGITLDGKTGDLNIADVEGPVMLNGDFFGTTHLEHVAGAVRFKTSRTDFEMARLDGEMELDTGSDLRADQLLGPVVLATRDRNISLDRVQGAVRVTNRNGTVGITSTAPLGDIIVDNHHGSVDLGVPGTSNFSVDASTHDGEVENDFALPKSGSDNRPTLQGTVGRGGPSIHVVTTEGDVTVRKSSVLPLAPPAPPVLILNAPAPVAPPAPKAPKAPRPPKLAVTAPPPPAPPTM